MQNIKIKKESWRAFTLIELVVVMAAFLFIIGAAAGIFLSIVQNQKRVLSEQKLLNQISYAEEYMSKALRMAMVDTDGTACFGDSKYAGYIYLLTHGDSGSYEGIKFINQSDNNGACQEFFLDTTGVLEETDGGGSPVALTSTDLKINFISFALNGLNNLSGTSYSDAVQPRVTILLNVSIPGEAAKTIQTTVSQRNLNTNNGQR